MYKTSVKEMESDINTEIVDKKENNVVCESSSETENVVGEVEKSDSAEISDGKSEIEKIESIKQNIYNL